MSSSWTSRRSCSPHPAAAHHADDLGHRRDHVQAGRRVEGTGEEGHCARRRRRPWRATATGSPSSSPWRSCPRARNGWPPSRRRAIPWFNISTGTGWFHTDRSWNDTLDIPLSGIQTYIGKLNAGVNIDRPTEQVRAERDRITAEYRELITNEADLKQFDELLGCAKTVFPYVENHLFYVEHWFHSVFWNKMREVAAIMKEHGLIKDIEDIWLLRRDEIKQALWDVVTAWATGVTPRGSFTWPPEIEWRKGVMEKFRQWSPPPAIGIAPEVIQEPFTIVLWGVTNKSLADWSAVQDIGDPDSITELKGFAGSPGIVEGKARVCRSAMDIRDLQEGEILVAPTTSPSWAPAFAKIKACVTDVGGVMSHAAIVCREYGLPAIVGTGHATKVIKTGMMLRVDGSSGVITITR
jgi:pyruvate,water dikinase